MRTSTPVWQSLRQSRRHSAGGRWLVGLWLVESRPSSLWGHRWPGTQSSVTPSRLLGSRSKHLPGQQNSSLPPPPTPGLAMVLPFPSFA